MSKAVMISIKPKLCELIASGKKTVEVRKSRPKIKTPFKCYIYCTKAENLYDILWTGKQDDIGVINRQSNGYVIGEFVCDEILKISVLDFLGKNDVSILRNIDSKTVEFCEKSCLSFKQILDYANGKPRMYYWHISNLVIYDEPKRLGSFNHPCIHKKRCEDCIYSINEERFCYDESIGCDRRFGCPPQSWCYVEEV